MGVAAEVIVGPSRYLPWPLDVVAHRSWDEGALWYRRARHVLPVPIAQRLSAIAERVQRPRLAVWRTTAGPALAVASNDPALVQFLTNLFVGSEWARSGSVERSGIRPDSTFDADFAAVEIPTTRARDFVHAGWLVLPRWIAMEVNLAEDERTLWDSPKRETVRRIERSGFALEVSRNLDDAHAFHRLMYAPTARARHDETAIVVRRGFVEAGVRSGFLLFVRHEGARRAGLLLVPRPGKRRVVDALLSGVLDGDYGRTKLAREAAYLFSIRWARDVYRASQLGLTGAAPFVHDGILRYKRRWGATALADLRQPGCIAVRVRAGSPEIYRALAEQPPIALRFSGERASLFTLALRFPPASAPSVPHTPGITTRTIQCPSPSDLPRLIAEFSRA